MIEKIFNKLISLVQAVKYVYLRIRMKQTIQRNRKRSDTSLHQNLEIYSTPEFAHSVDRWGAKTTWREIQHLLVNCKGKILDIACGTAAVYPYLDNFLHCEYYGCDISAPLIAKAIEIGISSSKLKVCDATDTGYADYFFDYSFSIGSLEHFTEEGISRFLKECDRITKHTAFHQIPTSRNGRDEGWIQLNQSYFNNSVPWWLGKFRAIYPTVHVLDSSWEDPISVGKWFICVK